MTRHSNPIAFGMLCASLLSPNMTEAQDNLNFREDFQGTSLSPAFRIGNPDPDRWLLVEREHLLLVVHKDRKNVIQYDRPLPQNFFVTLRIEEPPRRPNQRVQIRIGDDDNHVRVAQQNGNYSDVYLLTDKRLKGENAAAISMRDDGVLGKPLYLRLQKVGVEFFGAYSTDGVKWTSVGEQVLIAPSAKVHFEVYGLDGSPESPIKIDSFEITEILN